MAKGKPDDAARERLQRNLGMALEMIEQQYNLWQAWRREDKDGAPPMARWVTATRDGDLVLHGSRCRPRTCCASCCGMKWTRW